MQIINAIQSNGLAAAGIAYVLGLASANVPLIIHFIVTSAWVSSWIKKNPALAESIVNSLKKEVDAEAAPPAP